MLRFRFRFRSCFRSRFPSCAALVGATLIAPSLLWAGGSQSFTQSTAADFEEGEATASIILPLGALAPGRTAARAPVQAAFVWAGAAAPDGKTVFFGTGDQGRIFAVGIPGTGGKLEGRPVAKLDAPWVTALAVRSDGSLIAGTTPDARVFVVDRKGAARLFVKLDAEHVWALAHDPKANVTYAATGQDGKVFAIDAAGKARVVWDSGDQHVVSLLPTGEGRFLAGTSPGGIVYRLGPGGKAEAINDFEGEEVRALVRSKDAVYLAVNDFSGTPGIPPAPAPGAKPGPRGTTRITLGTGPAPAAVGRQAPAGSVKARAAVYRMGSDDAVERVFTLADGYLTALLVDGQGRVFAASGTKGKVYELLPDRTFTVAADLTERQALTLISADGGFFVGTGDVGSVHLVRPAAPKDARYLSKVFDADVRSTWGRVRWTGTAGITLETRSGNTAKPGSTWGSWQKVREPRFASGKGEASITSAPGRYLQYRVGFAGAGATLDEISLFYLPQNQRPRVLDVTLAEPAKKPAKPPAGATPPPTGPSLLKLRFKVENPDEDELLYRLAYRGLNEKVWRELGGPEPLTKPEYDWNTESVPDGRYRFRVWVTDEKANASGRALDSTYVSEPFLVDNTRPRVSKLAARSPMVTGVADDGASLLTDVEFAVDGTDWRPVTPNDGLLDQQVEGFSFRLPEGLSKGPHVVTVRAIDEAGNVGATHLEVMVK